MKLIHRWDASSDTSPPVQELAMPTPPAQTTHDAEEDARNQHIKIYVNGEIVDRDEARVSVYDSGFMLGDGMWEGMRLYNGKWAFFDEHMDRLFETQVAEVGWRSVGKLSRRT